MQAEGVMRPVGRGVLQYCYTDGLAAASAAEERSGGEASSSGGKGREHYIFLSGAMSGVCEGAWTEHGVT